VQPWGSTSEIVIQRDAIALLFLRLHHYELMTSFVFAGLWLFPFGTLVYKSQFLPRILGAWLVLEGFGWPVLAVAGFVAPQYLDLVSRIIAPLNLAEVAIALWLLLFGARSGVSDGAARHQTEPSFHQDAGRRS
jgi:hypothetical protein